MYQKHYAIQLVKSTKISLDETVFPSDFLEIENKNNFNQQENQGS